MDNNVCGLVRLVNEKSDNLEIGMIFFGQTVQNALFKGQKPCLN